MTKAEELAKGLKKVQEMLDVLVKVSQRAGIDFALRFEWSVVTSRGLVGGQINTHKPNFWETLNKLVDEEKKG